MEQLFLDDPVSMNLVRRFHTVSTHCTMEGGKTHSRPLNKVNILKVGSRSESTSRVENYFRLGRSAAERRKRESKSSLIFFLLPFAFFSFFPYPRKRLITRGHCSGFMLLLTAFQGDHKDLSRGSRVGGKGVAIRKEGG